MFNNLYFRLVVKVLRQRVALSSIRGREYIGLEDIIADRADLSALGQELAVVAVDRVLVMVVQDLGRVHTLIVAGCIRDHATYYQELALGAVSMDILLDHVLILVISHPIVKDHLLQ